MAATNAINFDPTKDIDMMDYKLTVVKATNFVVTEEDIANIDQRA